MRELFTSTTNVTATEAHAINHLAARGFEQSESDMLEDTTRHILSAGEMQLLYDDEQMIAFALYKEHLWRQSC